MRNTVKRTVLSAALLVAVPALAACGTESTDPGGSGGGDARSLTVESSDDACEVSASEAPAGVLDFDVTNTGSQVTEFYLLGEDGLQIVAEIENIGPGATQKLTVNAPAGQYVTACKPGMVGDGIRSDFTITESDEEVQVADEELVQQAQAGYAAYVEDQSAQLLEKTRTFVELYKAGDRDDEARALYPVARTHWERIETVAESFGDLDPLMDAREADVPEGEEWTGWHRIEKDLWPARAEKYRALTPRERAFYADDLLANTEELDRRVQELTYTIDSIANGARGLLEEVATGKVTGEEERYSHTDLVDFKANVEGAEKSYELLKPVARENDAALVGELDKQFAALDTLLDQYREDRTSYDFTPYDKVGKADRKELSDAVNALAEPLSRLAAAVVK